MIEWWGPIINEYYGATETGVVVFCSAEEWLAHPGTVGKTDPGSRRQGDRRERRVAAAARGRRDRRARCRAAPDFTYHGDDAKRRAAEKAGLIAPGDVGYFDEDGFLYLCDRVKDMIISGGVNIYPAEIEAELHKMPGVADCAVFGIPDDEYGESVCAVVQPQPGASLTEVDVRAYLRGAGRRLQGAQARRVPRRPAARRLRQNLQAQAARALLGRPRPPHLRRWDKGGILLLSLIPPWRDALERRYHSA